MNVRIVSILSQLKAQREVIENAVSEIGKENDEKFLIEQKGNQVFYSLTEEGINGGFSLAEIRAEYINYIKNTASDNSTDQFDVYKIKTVIYDLIEKNVKRQYF